ncbi:hypothetical protein HHK36_016222 [Tetracentron sinense]|uniref:protein-serine/threonine phosphatase n=1 Tax=Tetracentron sinense TaxID=13715 RepID=A0A835DEH8_TETSI|nr:hypothetical protein HHK36_016222 [Tetracentron sinense]
MPNQSYGLYRQSLRYEALWDQATFEALWDPSSYEGTPSESPVILMSRFGFKSAVYFGTLCLGEVEILPVKNQYFHFPNNEIRIRRFSPSSERCPPLSILQTISPFGVRCKLESKAPVEESSLFDLHTSCLKDLKTAVVLLGDEELHLVAMPIKKEKFPCFWCCSVRLGLYDSCLRSLNLRCLAIVFDLDETLIVANTMRSFEDRIEALQHRIACETDHLQISGMSAELKRYIDDRSLLKQYIESDSIMDNGKLLKVQVEEVPLLSNSQQRVIRPVIRMQERNIVLTRINPESGLFGNLEPDGVIGVFLDEIRLTVFLKEGVESDKVIRSAQQCFPPAPPSPPEDWGLSLPISGLWQQSESLATRDHGKGLAREGKGRLIIRDTSVLVRLRPAWEDLRSYLTANGRKRFEVYVCTMAEKDYALEMWRLLDPEAHLIISSQLLDRVEFFSLHLPFTLFTLFTRFLPLWSVLNLIGSRKSLLNVFRDGIFHPKMAMVIDDRLKVWEDKDQPRVHVVPAFTPYYAPQAETANAIPVLCVARNVSCNARGGFFKEFDESLLRKISELCYEDEVVNLPSAPDVSNYLMSEDAGFELNGNRDLPIYEGMNDAEVERRLNHSDEKCTVDSATSFITNNPDLRPETSHHLTLSPSIIGPATFEIILPSQSMNLVFSLSKIQKGDGVSLSEASTNNRELQPEAGKVTLLPSSISIGVLQEIGRRSGSKVEFRSVVSTSKDLQFSVEVLFSGETIGVGMGKTKKDAQQQAAESALHSLADKYRSYVAPGSGAVDRYLDKLSIGNENGFLWDIVSTGSDKLLTEDGLPKASTSEAAEEAIGSSTSMVNQQAQKRANSPRVPTSVEPSYLGCHVNILKPPGSLVHTYYEENVLVGVWTGLPVTLVDMTVEETESCVRTWLLLLALLLRKTHNLDMSPQTIPSKRSKEELLCGLRSVVLTVPEE